VVCAFREADLVVFLVVLEPVLLPCHRATGMLFVDTISVVVVVVAFAVARRVRTAIGLAFLIPRVKAFSELLKNSLTGLAMQSVVLGVVFQLVFQVFQVWDLAGFVPHLAGVVVSDVPEFAGTPPMSVERLCNL